MTRGPCGHPRRLPGTDGPALPALIGTRQPLPPPPPRSSPPLAGPAQRPAPPPSKESLLQARAGLSFFFSSHFLLPSSSRQMLGKGLPGLEVLGAAPPPPGCPPSRWVPASPGHAPGACNLSLPTVRNSLIQCHCDLKSYLENPRCKQLPCYHCPRRSLCLLHQQALSPGCTYRETHGNHRPGCSL